MANFTGNRIKDTFNRVVQIDPQSTGSRGTLQDGLGNSIDATIKSLVVSESLDVAGGVTITGSVNLGSGIDVTGNGTISGDLTVGGTVTAQEFHTEQISSSIIFESGSTQFGDSTEDVHTFSGSINHSGNMTTIGTHEVEDGSFGPFFANPQSITKDITLPSNYNSRIFGPITVAAGKTLTVAANAKLEITDI